MENNQTAASKFFNKNEKTFLGLYGRWINEKEYEDFKDYGMVMKSTADKTKGIEFVCAKKRPFGIVFNAEGKTYQIKVTAKSYEYKRIK